MKVYQVILMVLFLSPKISLAEVFFHQDFESGSLGTWERGTYTSVVTNPARVGGSGTKSLEFLYKVNEFHSEQRFTFGGQYPEVWIRYWARVPTNFYHSTTQPSNNKFFAIWIDDYSAHGAGSSVVWEYWTNGKGGSDMAVHYSEGGYTITGEHLQFTPFISYPSDQGRWMQVMIYVKRSSSPTSRDGVVEFYRRWSNESKFTRLHRLSDAKLVVPEGYTGWRAGYFMGWSNPSFKDETKWYIDDVEFSSTPFLDSVNPPMGPQSPSIIN